MPASRLALAAIAFLTACSSVAVEEPASGPSTPAGSPTQEATSVPGEPSQAEQSISIRRVETGLNNPVAIAFRPSATPAYVVEQAGRIMALRDGSFKPFLDIRGRVLDGGERGMLGLAFDPFFGKNRFLYVMYTDGQGDLRVSRFKAYSHRKSANYRSEVVLMDIRHRQYANHNGGQLAFDPDGFLVIATGDGGSGGGPNGYAQSKTSLLGKLLRIAPRAKCGSRNYCVPAKNPFVVNGQRSPILHWGLRNPWRFSYAPDGRLFIADVGQDAREEISVVGAGVRGKNLGWDCREGTLNTVGSYGGSYCSGRTFLPPVHEYSPTGGRCAIVGGYIVGDGGTLDGRYLFGDYCSGEIFSLRQSSGDWVANEIADHGGFITSFGRAPDGRVFFVDSAGGYYRVMS
ncbi:MAG: PQQ-dependent sugar dehydrogenase [Actinomycetota bacterium]